MIQSIRGTKDLLPDTIYNWQYVEQAIADVSHQFGYSEIRTPIFEKTEVFSRGVGEDTDIVNKEMYTFDDKGGESVTLRPEQTAALVRACIQSSLYQQQSITRLWYFGPYFRYERPQKGRLRQFHQYGAECIASPFPESDVEIINLATSVCKNIGIDDYSLRINSLGNEESRAKYKQLLIEYLNDNKDGLSIESQNRLENNPLRVLDSKAEQDIIIAQNAPSILDSLDGESKEHFDIVLDYLNLLGIKYVVEPKLVRGLDYYCHTVFEFQSNALGSQDAFGGGGRYNGLFSQLGGKETPAVGFAMGVERLLLILEAIGKLPNKQLVADYFVLAANSNFTGKALEIASLLRASGKSVICDLQRRSFKAQMREAGKLNIPYVLIVAEDEYARGSVLIKDMLKSEQKEVSINELTML